MCVYLHFYLFLRKHAPLLLLWLLILCKQMRHVHPLAPTYKPHTHHIHTHKQTHTSHTHITQARAHRKKHTRTFASLTASWFSVNKCAMFRSEPNASASSSSSSLTVLPAWRCKNKRNSQMHAYVCVRVLCVCVFCVWVRVGVYCVRVSVCVCACVLCVWVCVCIVCESVCESVRMCCVCVCVCVC